MVVGENFYNFFITHWRNIAPKRNTAQDLVMMFGKYGDGSTGMQETVRFWYQFLRTSAIKNSKPNNDDPMPPGGTITFWQTYRQNTASNQLAGNNTLLYSAMYGDESTETPELLRYAITLPMPTPLWAAKCVTGWTEWTVSGGVTHSTIIQKERWWIPALNMSILLKETGYCIRWNNSMMLTTGLYKIMWWKVYF